MVDSAEKVSQEKDKGDRSAKFELDVCGHFVSNHTISGSVANGNCILGKNSENVLKETKVETRASFHKECDEMSDTRDSDNLIGSESADKVSQEKNKVDCSTMYEFHESENFANKHTIDESVVDNNDVRDGNIKTEVKESRIVASCSSNNTSAEHYSLGNEISEADANNRGNINKN